MSAQRNKTIIQSVWAALADGDGGPFVEAMHEDFVFRPVAPSYKAKWANSYSGKQTVIEQFFRPWRMQTVDGIRQNALNIIADGDLVVIESKGSAQMKSGERYDQDYCVVVRMHDGKMIEMREYFDNALADALFEPI